MIAINQYVHQFLRSDGQQRIWDIENAVADSWFNLDRMSEPGRILAPSVIVPRKNIAGLIRAMALVVEAYPSAQLRIAGPLRDEAYGAECRALANALGIADRVEFLGSLAVPEMQDELARAQCLALASFNETSPLVISEAMAAGVPVVASRLCGMPWMVVEGFTGRLVNPHDDADIARALLRVLRDDDCVAMGHAARAQAEDRFRASVVAQRTLAVYGAVLGRNG